MATPGGDNDNVGPQMTESVTTGAVGRSIPREDGRVKVTGRAEYAYDVELPNMLHAAFVRSPYAHARVLDIDTSEAETMAGVHAVLTQADFPDTMFGDGVFDQTCLAADRVLFEGHFVAVVAAETKRQAEAAVQAVTVEYERLTPVVDGEAAFAKEPPAVVHPDLHDYETAEVLPPTFVEDRPNVYQHYTVRHGDVEAGFAAADHVYEATYRTAPVAHAPMEPHVAVARPEGDGELTIWTSCQAVHKIKNMTARVLGKPARKLRVIEPYVGGSYGGKESPLLEPIAGRLADVTGRPVRVVHSREEEFKNATISGEFRTTVTTGVTDDGDIVARKVEAICPGGAYTSTGFLVARNATFAVANSYSIPNLHVDTYGVYTNTPVSGSYRGFGNRQLTFALESQLDEIARDLDLDPIAFRRQNLLAEGEITAFNEPRTHVVAAKCLDAAADRLPFDAPPDRGDEWVSGTGFVLVNKHSLAPTASSAIVKVHPDATVELRYSSDEIGQGNTTAMAQIVAEEFGVPVEQVAIVRGDTDVTPFDQGSISSRSTFNMGNAVRLACADAKSELFEHAAETLEIPPEDLETAGGRVHPKGDPDAGIAIEEVFTAAIYESGYFLRRGGEIIGKDTWVVEAGDPEPDVVGRVNSFYSEGVLAVQVSVDRSTGQVVVDDVLAVFDVGRAINPRLVEERSGRTVNANYSDYKIPTAHEHPLHIEHVVLEETFEEGPYGAKGIGEVPIVSVAPAVANAIHDATGVRLRSIPFTPEAVFSAVRSAPTASD